MYRAFVQAALARAALLAGAEPVSLHCAEWMTAWQEIRYCLARQLTA